MDRRKFLKAGIAATVAASVKGLPAVAAEKAAGKSASHIDQDPVPSAEKIKVRFLGTGAADWKGPDDNGEYRRRCSVLINDSFLIDYTECNRDMIPAGCHPETAFYTHSHDDHYDPAAALRLGIRKVYLGETWISRARNDFRRASAVTGIPEPEIIPVSVGCRYEESGVVVMPVPANHATSDMHELTLIYLLESLDSRVLYATDTAGIVGIAARYVGIDAHLNGKPVNGFIMEATMGIGHEDDFRIFNHSSVATVAQVCRVLKATRRYVPKRGQPAYITHMSRKLHGTQKELDKNLPAPLKAAYDGLEVEF